MKKLSLINKNPLIWGHRGARSLAPENTLRAMRMAHDKGADGWEIDVQPSSDGELIVLHDLNLLRTTNAGVHPLFKGRGLPLPWLFTLKELKALSADVFPRRLCPPHYSEKPWLDVPESVAEDVCIPTLEEVLSLAKELGMWINIEIKDISHAVPKELEHDIVEKVHAAVAANAMNDQIILSSFNHSYMAKSKDLNSDIPTGLLTPHSFNGDPVMMIKEHRANAWHPGFKFLTKEIVWAVRDFGAAINPYTVNDPEDMKRLTKWGVTGLVTDVPQDAVK